MAERRTRRQVDGVVRRSVDFKVEVLVKAGSIAEQVVDVALAYDAVMIVIGKGRRAGDLAERTTRIARIARRPVVIVPGKWNRGLRKLPRQTSVRRQPRLSRVA